MTFSNLTPPSSDEKVGNANCAKARAHRRADAIVVAARYLANAGPTATGATLILPDGEHLYLSVATARAMCGRGGVS